MKWDSLFLKKFELLAWRIGLLGFCTEEQLNIAKLFVSDAHDANFSKFWQHGLHTFAMDLCIFHTGTMTHIDRELEHGEAILHQTFTEQSVLTYVFLCFRW